EERESPGRRSVLGVSARRSDGGAPEREQRAGGGTGEHGGKPCEIGMTCRGKRGTAEARLRGDERIGKRVGSLRPRKCEREGHSPREAPPHRRNATCRGGDRTATSGAAAAAGVPALAPG